MFSAKTFEGIRRRKVSCLTIIFIFSSFTFSYLGVVVLNPKIVGSRDFILVDQDGTNKRSNCSPEFVETSLLRTRKEKDSTRAPKRIWDVRPPALDPKCLDESVEPKNWKQFPEESTDFIYTEEGKQYKKILFWNYAYGNKNVGFGFGRKLFSAACCEEPRCFFTGNASALPIDNFDAILFHFRSFSLKNLPKKRSPHQRWVFYEQESPSYSFQDPANCNGLFNWTMTYRKDSDIYASYSYVYPKNKTSKASTSKSTIEKPRQRSLHEGDDGKKVLAAWMVSHCKTISFRENFVRELQDYIGVDVYGECGHLKCSTEFREKCYSILEKKYKFYLSFENSLCKDYVTEKFFNILRYDLVPVVLGLGDYASIAPPHSYIDVLSFKSIKHLADYLIYLDKNDTAYNEYFKWKENYTVLKWRWHVASVHFCALCKKLHEDRTPKTYWNMKKWFYDNARCKRLLPRSWMEKALDLFNINLLP